MTHKYANSTWGNQCRNIGQAEDGRTEAQPQDNILFNCPTCDEEYNLPETTTVCPICGGKLQPLL